MVDLVQRSQQRGFKLPLSKDWNGLRAEAPKSCLTRWTTGHKLGVHKEFLSLFFRNKFNLCFDTSHCLLPEVVSASTQRIKFVHQQNTVWRECKGPGPLTVVSHSHRVLFYLSLQDSYRLSINLWYFSQISRIKTHSVPPPCWGARNFIQLSGVLCS